MRYNKNKYLSCALVHSVKRMITMMVRKDGLSPETSQDAAGCLASRYRYTGCCGSLCCRSRYTGCCGKRARKKDPPVCKTWSIFVHDFSLIGYSRQVGRLDQLLSVSCGVNGFTFHDLILIATQELITFWHGYTWPGNGVHLVQILILRAKH